MLEINNREKFETIVKDALTKAAAFPRWMNAIKKAAAQIEENGEFMTWQPESKSLLIWNQDSNNIHSANGVCDCEAFKRGFPCFHRAAARLVRLYLESPADAELTYLKQPTGKKPQTCGNIRF